MNIIKRNIVITILLAVIISVFSVIAINFSIDESNEGIAYDKNMKTTYYKSEVTINDDNSYLVNETIDLNFITARHGIYRYIPFKGSINKKTTSGKIESVPYYADVKIINSNEKINSIENKSGNKCIIFGDEDVKLKGKKQYLINYKVTPKVQGKYSSIYYNIFPTYWQNSIPDGSEFIINFPKEIDHDIVKLYYGSFGETNDASNILSLKWNGNILSGKLIKSLPAGSGITIYAPVSDSYFTKTKSVVNELYLYIIGAVIISLVSVVIYFKYGRGEKVIPSIQYYPPKDMDSAKAGYIIDGYAGNEEIISLFIYLADKGYLKIEKNKKDSLAFIKVKDLDENIPNYIAVIFNGLFKKSKENKVELSSLKYNFASKIEKSKAELRSLYSKDIYTVKSRVFRVLFAALSILPITLFIMCDVILSYTSIMTAIVYVFIEVVYALGIILLCSTLDSWYVLSNAKRFVNILLGSIMFIGSISGVSYIYLNRTFNNISFKWYASLLVMIISSLIIIICAVNMKKRTDKCIENMGYLIGFRDFIEKAELDRIKELAEENPYWFYSVLPYAYVFGLSDVWIKKFKDLSLPKPEWYYGNDNTFVFYSFNTMLMSDLDKAEVICTSVKPSSNSSGSSFGGSSGGGGFSGGGFGGGGGGSW